MKDRNRILSAFALLALAVTATPIRAQTIYTPYAFTNFAGSPGLSGTNNNAGSAARFNTPGSVAVDSAGTIYVDDFGNHTIRKITSAGVVTTLAGLGGTAGTSNGTGSAARFNGPATLDVDRHGTVYVTDYFSHTIRQVTPAGVVTTLAGAAGVPGTNDGTGNAARFNNPIGVAVDSATNVYVGDSANHTIRKITPVGADWVVTTLAGSAGHPGSTNGSGNAARFNNPHHVRVDSAGNIFVADTDNHTIRKITPAGNVTTLAGRAGFAGSADGTGSVARFRSPYGVAVTTNGNVYVADTDNHTIRRITPDGAVTTLAGRPLFAGSVNGTGNGARFLRPYSLAMESAGNIYVADSENHRITKGSPLLQFEKSMGSQSISSGYFQMQLLGPFSSNAVVEASADLVTWTAVQTNALPAGTLDISLSLATNQNQFFRARLAP